MPSRTTIRFTYDIVSPWSYLAYAVLKRYRSYWNFDLILNPIWLGAVMIASQNSPPMEVPNKGKHMSSEIPMMAKFFQVEYHEPSKFPTKTIYAMRLLRTLQVSSPSSLEIATDKLYEAQFVTRQSIEDFESLKTILQASVPSIEEHISASKTSEAKDGMKADAEQLVGSGGAFGFPWMEVTRTDGRRLRLFGSDRFEFLANWLGVRWHGPCPAANEVMASKL